MVVQWRAFPLHPETPVEGLSLEKFMAHRPGNVRDMQKYMKRTAESLNLPFGNPEMLFNSRLAQELGLWAESKGKGSAFHMAAFRANFVTCENIAMVPVLLEIAHSVDLSREEANEVLDKRLFKEAVDEDWALSRAKGITAVPTLVFNFDKLVGAQPYENMEQFTRKHGIKRRE